jgi:hypothetical protein
MSTGYVRLVADYSKYGARLAVGTRSESAAESAAENLSQRHSLDVQLPIAARVTLAKTNLWR